MRLLVIILIFHTLITNSHCSQPTHVDHMCGGSVTTEQAGMGSGTVTFDGSMCILTITDIPELQNKSSNTIDQVSRLNIVGVKRSVDCYYSPILIDAEPYCLDESVKDTVITVTNQQMKFALVSDFIKPITLTYYRGEPLEYDAHFSLHQ